MREEPASAGTSWNRRARNYQHSIFPVDIFAAKCQMLSAKSCKLVLGDPYRLYCFGKFRKGCSKLKYKKIPFSPALGPTPIGTATPGTI